MKNTNIHKEMDTLGLEPELLSASSLNQFCIYDSASRLAMFNTHLSQMLPLNTPDEKIIQSGVERELGKATFSKKLDANARIISVIPRYKKMMDSSSVNHTVDKVVIYEDLDTGEYNMVDIPLISDYHQYFGFKYKETTTAKTMSHNTTLKKGTVLAKAASISENDGYKFGVNLDMVLMTHPEIAEDAVIISKSTAKKLGINIYERRVISFGIDKFPLNIYGDEETYKPFPDIGEKITDYGLLMALRKHDDYLAPGLMSKNDIRDFNPIFDECTYVKKGGGTIIDIKSNYTPKYRTVPYKNTDVQAKKYADALRVYYQQIVDTCEDISKDHYAKYKTEYVTSPPLTRLLVEAYVYLDSVNSATYRNIKKVYKNDPIDIYTVEFVIEHTLIPDLAYKLTDLHGGKGVVCKIWDDDKMPITKDGVRADIITDSSATISRMNIGRLYESYISASSRKVKSIITDIYKGKDIMDVTAMEESWGHIIDFLKIINTEQLLAYNNITDFEDRLHVIREILEKEFYVYYPINPEIKAPDLIPLLENSIYSPLIDSIYIPDRITGELKETKGKILIAPFYIVLLYKIADSWLATASSKVNHFGLPIGVSKKDRDRLPGKNAPVKILSETEVRLYLSYTDELAMAELKDRANSISTHKHVYNHILRCDNPADIDMVVDRTIQPYGEDKSLEIIDAIFKCAGCEIYYSDDVVPEYEYLGLDSDIEE